VWKGDFRCPEGIAVDAHGNVYVADSEPRNRVIKLSPDGTWLAVWHTPGFREGAAGYVQAVAMTRRGRVFVTEIGGEGVPRVVEFSSTGKVRGIWR